MMPFQLFNGDMMSTNHARLNLLYVFADQWRAQAVGCPGGDDVVTPHMDAFANRSLVCKNAISTYPLCSPHRAALLTGRHPLSCGFWTNCKAPLSDAPYLRDEEVTIGDIALDSGYDTAYIGKWHLSQSERNINLFPPSGARGWDAYTPPGKGRHGFHFWHSYGAMDEHLHPHYWENSPEQLHYDVWSPTHETDVLLSYLQKRPLDKPFFAILSWNPPHPPYGETDPSFQYLYENMPSRKNVPQEWKNNSSYRKAKKEYFGAISALDREFGRIIAYLETQHLMESTIVVLSADHGDMMGSHGLYGKNIWYDEAVRIPLYIYDPRRGAGITDCLFASEDHAPTLLDLLGLPIPLSMEGISHAKTLSGISQKERKWVYQCMIPGMPNVVASLRNNGFDPMRFGWRAIREKNRLFVINRGMMPEKNEHMFVYNLIDDPYEEYPSKPSKDNASYFQALIQKAGDKVHDPFMKGKEVE